MVAALGLERHAEWAGVVAVPITEAAARVAGIARPTPWLTVLDVMARAATRPRVRRRGWRGWRRWCWRRMRSTALVVARAGRVWTVGGVHTLALDHRTARVPRPRRILHAVGVAAEALCAAVAALARGFAKSRETRALVLDAVAEFALRVAFRAVSRAPWVGRASAAPPRARAPGEPEQQQQQRACRHPSHQQRAPWPIDSSGGLPTHRLWRL